MLSLSATLFDLDELYLTMTNIGFTAVRENQPATKEQN